MNRNLKNQRLVQACVTALSLGALLLPLSPVVLAQPTATYCDRVARDYARSRSSGGPAFGAGTGAIGGGVIGAIAGGSLRNATRGAAAGAAVGSLAGTATQGAERDRLYELAFNDCMNGNLGNWN
ncbi:MAG: hypothetical protein HC890_08615 [Chloroflexaceae bacterium]|nr:hypothetical protein [Chloroflexaceae bacterium]